MKQVTVILDDELHKSVKIKLAENGKTFKEYFIRLIKKDLETKKEQTR